MKEKIDLYRPLLFWLPACLLLLDGVLRLAGQICEIPGSHKQLLLTGFLLWFVTLMLGRDRDDDWAGQF